MTGGASGIGLGIVRALVDAGAVGVFIADVDAKGAERVADEVAARGLKAGFRVCDFSTESEVEALADDAWPQLGDVQLVFSNAGVTAHGDPLRETEADTR